MFPKVTEVLALLEEIAPSQLAESWDNPGLQVGSPSQEITRILATLDPTPQAIRFAEERQAQLLLTHHPLIFKPLRSVDFSVFPGEVILEAARKGISVIAAHTNLDAAKGGLNDILAELLGLKNLEVLDELKPTMNASCEVGLGRVGDLPNDLSLSELVDRVKEALGTKKLRILGDQRARVRRIAVVGGSGGSLLPLAKKKGADLLLTGDVGHHQALEARLLGIGLLDGGHFSMEKVAFSIFARRLGEMMADRQWAVAVELVEEEVDPMDEALR
jgi:dinuclear metal center YbgI/SA1388 family protein